MTGSDTEIPALLQRLSELGIEVFAQGDRLLCRGARRAITPQIRAQLAARKREILDYLRRSAVVPREAPLSYAQQRLWFLDQMLPQQATYTLPMAQHLSGPLDIAALRRSLEELVRRHEILRSNFPIIEGSPIQSVALGCEVDFSVLDLTRTPSETRDADVQRLIRAEFAKPFDLESDRLLRVRIYKLGAESHVFVLTLHHMVADGWSVALISGGLAALYTAIAARKPLPPNAGARQYADYARWQRHALSGEALAAHVKYWIDELSGVPPVLALPADRTRPPVPSYRGQRLDFEIDAAVTAALRQLARQSGSSLFMVLLGAYGVLLSRHTRQDVILIGTPIAGRNRPEWANVVGCFVNTLAMRVDLTGDPTFVELLGRVRETALGAFDHQDVPFERLVEVLRPDRDLTRNPIVQVSLGLHNAPGQMPLTTFALPGLDATPIDVDPGTIRFDLELDLWEIPSGGLHGRQGYAVDLFESATAAGMISQFQVLLSEIAMDTQRPVSRIPIITAPQQREILARWQPAISPRPSGPLLHDLVRRQAARSRDAVAVVCGDTRISYGELLDRVAVTAAAIRRAGVAAGDCVALCVTRGPHAVIAMLAILETGAAYVPADPEYPPARLALMLEETAARMIVTEPQFRERFAGADKQIVSLGQDDLTSETECTEPQRRTIDAESVAYVMCTSGSTGRPKGVAVPHSAVVGLLDAIDRVLPLGPDDVFLAVTTFAFDISVLELFLPLSHGAQLVLARRQETLDGSRLAAAISEHGVTAMQATPATWGMLIESGWAGAPAMTALCGGEALPAPLAEALRARCRSVWNVYGPTETTIWASAGAVNDAAPLTIGYPLANTEMYILDRHLDLLPPGMVGEIWIGGHGISRGYINRPGLTAAAFLPDPFAPRAGTRMYRTGDLGRRRNDGRIECLGRIDHQFKFHGFRIEPGEIEAALLSLDGVAEAVVLLSGAGTAHARVVAYVAGSGQQPLSLQMLRRHVQDRLPPRVVPNSFALLNALPKLPNGKIDRAALPTAAEIKPVSDKAASIPAGAVERALAEIWAAVLGVEHVDVETSFFDLGGHSLLLATVRSQIAKRLGRDVSVLDLFRYPTIRALATHLSGAATPLTRRDAVEDVASQIAALERLAQAAERVRANNA